jgi:hypothetical protein
MNFIHAMGEIRPLAVSNSHPYEVTRKPETAKNDRGGRLSFQTSGFRAK